MHLFTHILNNNNKLLLLLLLLYLKHINIKLHYRENHMKICILQYLLTFYFIKITCIMYYIYLYLFI